MSEVPLEFEGAPAARAAESPTDPRCAPARVPEGEGLGFSALAFAVHT
jgi:hypothetical protein